MSSQPCYETLTLVSRYFKPKFFLKMPHLMQFAVKTVIVLWANWRVKLRSWASPKISWEKTWTLIRHQLEQEGFLKKRRFHEIDIKNSEFKHPNIIEIRCCLLDRARTAPWQQSKFSFTLAKSKIFWKDHFVANWRQKYVPGFLT